MTLPAAQRAQLERLQAEQNINNGGEQGQPPASSSEEGTQVDVRNNADDGNVTMTREEFNDLQAAADRVRAAEGRMENLQMDKEALEARLTALENASKGNGQGGSSSQPSASEADEWSPSEVQFSDQEHADYGESESFVEKVALKVFNREFAKIFPSIKHIKGALSKVEETTNSNARRTQEVEGRDFNDQVKAALTEKGVNFDDVVTHQHWRAFCESDDPQTGLQYAQVLGTGIQNRKKPVVTRVMMDFATKYGLAKRSNSGTGYEGGAPGGGSRLPERNDEGENILPFSKRKEAHKKWIDKQITDAEYQRIADEYSKAEKENRIDYKA